MKRIVSILMVISIMILSMGTVFAYDEAVANGLNIAAVEDENGLITVTVSANDTVAIQGATVFLTLSGVKAVNASDKATEVTTAKDACEVALNGWAITTNTYTSGQKIKIVVGTSTATVLSNDTIFTAYFVKADPSATLLTSAFAYGETTATQSKLDYTGSITKTTKTPADRSYFGIKVVPYTAPGGGDEGGDDFVEGDWTETTVNNNVWNADDFTYVDATTEEKTTGAYAGKKVVAFGKNASNKAYASGEYGVTIGANKYPGLATVEVGQTFAIVLIDTNNDAKVKGTYTYSIWTLENGAEVTKASGLNAQ